jgi:ABC-type transport system involved in multi-copper enzyme maturation permease subunit
MAARFVGVIFALMSLAAAGLVVYQTQFLGLTSWNGTESPTVNSVIVAVALLLVTVGAVTALGDERARGSLDILLVTPLPTAAVLWAKWRSAFSLAPRVLFLTLVVAWATWDARLRQAAGVFWPTEPTKPVFDVFLVLLHPLAAAAMLTSLGLLLATWCKRFGQAVGLAVAAYIVIGPAWYLVISSWMAHGPETSPFMMFSPLFAARELTMNVRRYYGPSNSMCFGAFASMAAYLVLAVFFYVLTLLLFDRKMGRTSLPEAKAPRTDVPDPDHAILTASS